MIGRTGVRINIRKGGAVGVWASLRNWMECGIGIPMVIEQMSVVSSRRVVEHMQL